MNIFPRLNSWTITARTMARVCGILIIVWLFPSILKCLLFCIYHEELREEEFSKSFPTCRKPILLTSLLKMHIVSTTLKCTYLHEVSYIAIQWLDNKELMWNITWISIFCIFHDKIYVHTLLCNSNIGDNSVMFPLQQYIFLFYMHKRNKR